MRSTYRAPLVIAGLALASLAAGGLAAGGCAALSGLDGITELDCAPNCDGGGASDATFAGPDGASPATDSSTSVDATIPQDATEDTTPPPEDSAPRADSRPPPDAGGAEGGDASADSASADSAATDTGADAPPGDAGQDASMPDAGKADTGTDASDAADAGCGPTNTVDNCSACGDKCVPNGASSTACTGSTCTYTCKANFLDCNASTAPDLDGCECNSPGATVSQCCSGVCPQQHHYELGVVNNTTFYDCVPEGTYSVVVATDACKAFAGPGAQCTPYGCSLVSDGGFLGDVICSDGTGAPTCNCWGFDGQLTGLMSLGTAKGTTGCSCPQQPTPSWN